MTRVELNAGDRYINREISMLRFQHRVFHEAQSESNALLERVKFFAIVHDNLDEFFMVRVGGLRMQLDAGVVSLSIDGLTPAEQLAEIRKDAQALFARTRKFWLNELQTALDEAGIHVLDYPQLSEKQRLNANDYFNHAVFPVLTPLAFDPGHPFPHISNLSLNLAILIEDTNGERHFARLKVPATLPRLVPIKRSSGGVRRDGTVPHDHYFIWLEQLIAANLEALFPGMKIIEVHPFRVVRNADLDIQELEADDFLEVMEESVRRRRFGRVIQLAINEAMPEHIREILIENLSVDPNDLYIAVGPLGLSSLVELTRIDRYDLKDAAFLPNTPRALRHDGQLHSIFARIRENTIILHHPYDSFSPVIEFLEAAARDPDVLAIKQTLYRVGKNSPVVRTLLSARRDYGKQVAVLVELKARFDEESNIGWAKLLEDEGVHITYGLVGLKTHSKIAMVVRKEGDDIRRYVHLGITTMSRRQFMRTSVCLRLIRISVRISVICSII
jgi:polyphosphate kinase